MMKLNRGEKKGTSDMTNCRYRYSWTQMKEEEGQVEEAGGWYKLATAHGQLHMTGNCITLSSFCECQGGTQRWRRGRGKRGRDCTGCSHKMRPLRPPQKWVKEREGKERERERETCLCSCVSFLHSSFSGSSSLLLETALAPCFCCCCCKWQIRQCCCLPFAPRPSPPPPPPPRRALTRTLAPSHSNLWVVRASLVPLAAFVPCPMRHLSSPLPSPSLPCPVPVSVPFPLLPIPLSRRSHHPLSHIPCPMHSSYSCNPAAVTTSTTPTSLHKYTLQGNLPKWLLNGTSKNQA